MTMLTEEMRRTIYSELEAANPAAGKPSSPKHGKVPALPGPGADLRAQWAQEVHARTEIVLDRLLFQLHSLFDFREDESRIQAVVRRALSEVYDIENSCRGDGSYDAFSYALCLFRKRWHEGSRGVGDSGLSGLAHVDRAQFFSKVPQEIHTWARRFLLVERYHRLHPREGENRLDRFRLLRSPGPYSEITSLDDFLVRLDFRFMEESGREDPDVGSMARRLAAEIQGRLSPDLFPGEPLQPLVYLFLRCHRECLSEVVEPEEKRRLDHLHSTRQMDSLLDLMRVVIHRTTREHRLPEAAGILDSLKEEGFNISHAAFRDPYEADLVPPADTERFEQSGLPLFLPLDSLTGDFSADLEWSRKPIEEWNQRIVREVSLEVEEYCRASSQPLPRARLVLKLIRFAVSRALARTPWNEIEWKEDLPTKVLEWIPGPVLRSLIRPRKGYEIKSKQELVQRISMECRLQCEALERIARTRRIEGYHDYRYFGRYVLFQGIQTSSSAPLGPEVLELRHRLPHLPDPRWLECAANSYGLDISSVHPHTLDCVPRYLEGRVPLSMLVSELEKNFETSENELYRVARHTLRSLTPSFHRLLVAFARRRARLPRPECSPRDIPGLIQLLAPPLLSLEDDARLHILGHLRQHGGGLYRDQHPMCLFTEAEWKAALAWEVKKRIGDSPRHFLENGNPDQLLHSIEESWAGMQVPLGPLTHQTVQGQLIELFRPADSALSVPDAALGELTRLLPRKDCGACGAPGCREFVQHLVQGLGEARRCPHLSPKQLSEVVRRAAELDKSSSQDGRQNPNLLELLYHRSLWRGSEEKRTFQQVLSPKVQQSRRRFLERLEDLWNNLSPKPRIFRDLDEERIYRDLCLYLGYEAVERLGEEERDLLVQGGEEKRRAEWRQLKERRNWLALADEKRLSRPLLAARDVHRTSRETYDSVLFLHQLHPDDRRLVLRHRVNTFEDGFSRWWNEDLLTMNLPGYSIRDWEDFSKIIHNAYWHQESSVLPGEALAELEKEVLTRPDLSLLVEKLVGRWIDEEASRIARAADDLRSFRKGAERRPIGNVRDLRRIFEGLLNEAEALRTLATPSESSGQPSRPGGEDQRKRLAMTLWDRFQEEGFLFSPSFSFHWDELQPDERRAMENPAWGAGNGGSASPAEGVPPEKGPDGARERVSVVHAVLSTAVNRRCREQREASWVEERTASTPVPLGSLLVYVGRRLRQGQGSRELHREIVDLLGSNSSLRERVLKDALFRFIAGHLRKSLENPASVLPVSSLREVGGDRLPDPWEDLEPSLSRILDGNPPMDRERLFRYLFVLAKMEGNLDTLTALLREIRETSDIIEAAWLKFTEERMVEGPSPKAMPGTAPGIPLLASRLKDKGPLNRGLREGVSRKEKKAVASAVRELENLLRFHILLATDHGGKLPDPEAVIGEMESAGYDLTGIEEESLRTAVRKEIDRRERWAAHKIWIYTTAVARRLAAQHSGLQEVERELHKHRMDLLKHEPGRGGEFHRMASLRGVALGRIKEELYRQLSDLLEAERIASFQKRIRQIVEQLDQKRREIREGWVRGEINRRTVFYLLRQYQKGEEEPTWEDFLVFVRDHWLLPLERLRSSDRPDREKRIRDLDARFQALLGVSLLALEAETSAQADRDLESWIQDRSASLQGTLSMGKG